MEEKAKNLRGDGDDEKKSLDIAPPSTGNKVTPKLNFNPESSDAYRSTSMVSASTRSGFGKIDFVGGVQPAPFLASKNATNISNEMVFDLPIPGFGVKGSSTQKEVELIDVCGQDMEVCGMKQCDVFVPCALLEPLDDDIGLLVPGLIREEKKQEAEELCQSLKVNETCCVVSNGIEECVELVPLSLARVSNDLTLQLHSNASGHSPQVEGCVLVQRKSLAFAIHLYECPTDTSATVIEFQRRNGDGFAFQQFYDQCLEKFKEGMKNLRNCNPTGLNNWNSLPSLDGLKLDGFDSGECIWGQDCLNLLAGLIEDGSEEAVEMLGNLCGEMEKHVSLRTQVLQHKILMEQIVTRVLTHQDQCFVSLGLEALHISIDGEKVELIKEILRSFQTLAFVIALLNSTSMFVLRRTVRLLWLLASKCECPWKLSETQKQVLSDCIPRVQRNLLDNHSWSSTYATKAFVTKEMFQKIALHPKV